MTTRTNKRGLVMSLVIIGMGLVGVAMAVLAHGTNTMLFRADRAYLAAVERNLAASGLAWAQQRASQKKVIASAIPVDLDTHLSRRSKTGLTVSFTKMDAASVTVRIDTACSKGRQTVVRTREFTIERTQ